MLVLVIALLSFVICQGLNNGTPIYLAELGGTNSYAGWLIMEFSLAAALSRIIMSPRMDRSSRRSVMLAGACLSLAGSLGVVACPELQAQVVLRFFQGAGFGLCTTAASTAAADIVPRKRLGEGLGYYGLGQSLGMVIGPSLAIVLVTLGYDQSPWGPVSLFVGMAALAALLVLAVLGCSYERHPERLDPTAAYRLEGRGSGAGPQDGGSAGHERPSGDAEGPREGWLSRLFEPRALRGALPMAVICLGYALITNFVSKYGVEQGYASPGLFFVCAAITMTAVRLGGGRLIDGMRPLVLLIVPVACGFGCFALLALTRSLVPYYAAGALFGISMGIAFPLFNTVAVRCSPMERRGAATALYLLANDVGVGVGAVIGGMVIDGFGYLPAFWEGAAMMVLAFVAAAAVFPRKRQVWEE